MLAGPALIGWLTRLTALNHTFLLPALLLVIAAVAAGILHTGSEHEPDPHAQAGTRAAPLNTRAGFPPRRRGG